MSNIAKLEEVIKKHTQSEVGKKLYEILKKIWDRKEFIAYQLIALKTDANKQKLIDYIEQYDITDSSDVGDLTDCIVDGVEPEFEEE